MTTATPVRAAARIAAARTAAARAPAAPATGGPTAALAATASGRTTVTTANAKTAGDKRKGGGGGGNGNATSSASGSGSGSASATSNSTNTPTNTTAAAARAARQPQQPLRATTTTTPNSSAAVTAKQPTSAREQAAAAPPATVDDDVTASEGAADSEGNDDHSDDGEGSEYAQSDGGEAQSPDAASASASHQPTTKRSRARAPHTPAATFSATRAEETPHQRVQRAVSNGARDTRTASVLGGAMPLTVRRDAGAVICNDCRKSWWTLKGLLGHTCPAADLRPDAEVFHATVVRDPLAAAIGAPDAAAFRTIASAGDVEELRREVAALRAALTDAGAIARHPIPTNTHPAPARVAADDAPPNSASPPRGPQPRQAAASAVDHTDRKFVRPNMVADDVPDPTTMAPQPPGTPSSSLTRLITPDGTPTQTLTAPAAAPPAAATGTRSPAPTQPTPPASTEPPPAPLATAPNAARPPAAPATAPGAPGAADGKQKTVQDRVSFVNLKQPGGMVECPVCRIEFPTGKGDRFARHLGVQTVGACGFMIAPKLAWYRYGLSMCGGQQCLATSAKRCIGCHKYYSSLQSHARAGGNRPSCHGEDTHYRLNARRTWDSFVARGDTACGEWPHGAVPTGDAGKPPDHLVFNEFWERPPAEVCRGVARSASPPASGPNGGGGAATAADDGPFVEVTIPNPGQRRRERAREPGPAATHSTRARGGRGRGGRGRRSRSNSAATGPGGAGAHRSGPTGASSPTCDEWGNAPSPTLRPRPDPSHAAAAAFPAAPAVPAAGGVPPDANAQAAMAMWSQMQQLQQMQQQLHAQQFYAQWAASNARPHAYASGQPAPGQYAATTTAATTRPLMGLAPPHGPAAPAVAPYGAPSHAANQLYAAPTTQYAAQPLAYAYAVQPNALSYPAPAPSQTANTAVLHHHNPTTHGASGSSQ